MTLSKPGTWVQSRCMSSSEHLALVTGAPLPTTADRHITQQLILYFLHLHQILALIYDTQCDCNKALER